MPRRTERARRVRELTKPLPSAAAWFEGNAIRTSFGYRYAAFPSEAEAKRCCWCGSPPAMSQRWVCSSRTCRTLSAYYDGTARWRDGAKFRRVNRRIRPAWRGPRVNLHALIDFVDRMAKPRDWYDEEFAKRYPHMKATKVAAEPRA